jgi:asparagine synthase (glutamine-hydrolysing)
MCGICGALQQDGKAVTEALLRQMNDMIVHRGPDGEGYYCADNIGLAMRRLAIIDVGGSEQPLYNEDHSIAVVFNGEIYNYRELRHKLIQQDHRFHSDGDGETIVHLYEQYGEDAPQYLRGQFAFALWDSHQKRLFLARDRYGQKPLYYYHDADTFVFASEIKALLKHPAVPCESAFDNPQILALYLSYGYIPAPQTAFKNIRALMPASYLILESGNSTTRPYTNKYWQTPKISSENIAHTSDISHYSEIVRETLHEATELRMISDVPLGAFLSGGLDSSLIVALMQQMSNQQVKTFSMGFSGDDSFDESPYANQVAQYLETEHIAFTVEPQAMNLLEKLVWHHDQPFADSSAIPTFLVSELTRQHVTVALTGDGGDEQFAGYERFYAASLVQKLGVIPKPVWKFIASIIGFFPEGTGYYNLAKRAGRFARGASKPLALAYLDWVRVADSAMIRELANQTDRAGEHFGAFWADDTLASILKANQETYLPDDLLVKADRCSMAASLEARAPFLDHKLAESIAPIPLNLKLNGSITKYILKEASRGLLPDSIIDRKKHGFGVPLGAWLRKDISLVKDLLLSDRASQRKLFHMAAVEILINEHESGQRDHNRILWALLTLEMWHRVFVDKI